MRAAGVRVLVLAALDPLDARVANALCEICETVRVLSNAHAVDDADHVLVDPRDDGQVFEAARHSAAEVVPTHLVARATQQPTSYCSSGAFLRGARGVLDELAAGVVPVLQTAPLPQTPWYAAHCGWLTETFARVTIIRHRPADDTRSTSILLVPTLVCDYVRASVIDAGGPAWPV